MLTVSWSCVAQAAMTFVIIVMAIMFPVDSPNNRTEWPIPAAKFYVAVTRAAQSVAIVVEKPGVSSLSYWEPGLETRGASAADSLMTGR